MEIDTDKIILNALCDGVRDGIKSRLTSHYGSQNPVEQMFVDVFNKHSNTIRGLFDEALKSCITSDQFKTAVGEGVRHQMAKLLIQRFGGEMEKQVNALKSDPATRARITLAIEEIVKSQVKA